MPTEAFILLAQCHITLPPNLCEQVKWSRFINVHGLAGHNVSADLHMEHLNKEVKVAVEGLGVIISLTKLLNELQNLLELYHRC